MQRRLSLVDEKRARRVHRPEADESLPRDARSGGADPLGEVDELDPSSQVWTVEGPRVNDEVAGRASRRRRVSACALMVELLVIQGSGAAVRLRALKAAPLNF